MSKSSQDSGLQMEGGVASSPPSVKSRNVKSHFAAIFISWFLGYEFSVLWNSVVNAGDYFYAVLPDFHPDRVFPVVYIPLAVIVTYVYTFSGLKRANTRRRVLSGFWIYFIATCYVIMVSVANESWGLGQRWTFINICILVAFAGIGEGICGGGLYGEFSIMDPTYLQAFNAGDAASGVSTTALRLLTKLLFSDTPTGLRNGALTFFGFAGFAQLLGVFLYAAVFPRLEVIKIYRLNYAAKTRAADRDAEKKNQQESNAAFTNSSKQCTTKETLYQNWDYILDVIALYGVTYSIFPGFIYENTKPNKLGSWYPLLLIAVFNCADFLSRIVRVEALFMRSRRAIGGCCCGLMMVFIPAFYFTAQSGNLPAMILLCGMLGGTNGYFTICIFDTATQVEEGKSSSTDQSLVGNLLYLSMLIGFCIGLAADWFWLI